MRSLRNDAFVVAFDNRPEQRLPILLNVLDDLHARHELDVLMKRAAAFH